MLVRREKMADSVQQMLELRHGFKLSLVTLRLQYIAYYRNYAEATSQGRAINDHVTWTVDSRLVLVQMHSVE
jgi:hypothetical protein